MLTFPVSARAILASALLDLFAATPLAAAQCGNTAAGFDAWKRDFARIAAQSGIGERGLNALAGTSYATRTIAADRNQKSFGFTLERFMEVRGAATIVAQGKKRKSRDAAFYNALERQYGVPAGVIIAIHGMETAFGNFMGDSNVVSAIATLAYDCRRSEFFSGHALAALQLVDRGTISPQSVGAKHGELGHTQFLPGNVITYAVDANGDGRVDMNNMTDALASTANFLRQKGWQPGQGYQEGEPNFRVIKEWNAAGVYQKAIAIMGKRIDG
ncbi:lytic murein transglycosylase [Seohaeicola saemankumensis]|uniref:lytic murein transglycosylase n=1 Tax=Seohaeicola saemankumensis TaxID=481181 RepID=UPI001E371562|nr:lytic murein transglycosylase [Seohaeicola saemankumensis]MCD1624446.1 lytic murein transglycosylase [Seohaeicola saemankumensis]